MAVPSQSSRSRPAYTHITSMACYVLDSSPLTFELCPKILLRRGLDLHFKIDIRISFSKMKHPWKIKSETRTTYGFKTPLLSIFKRKQITACCVQPKSNNKQRKILKGFWSCAYLWLDLSMNFLSRITTFTKGVQRSEGTDYGLLIIKSLN